MIPDAMSVPKKSLHVFSSLAHAATYSGFDGLLAGAGLSGSFGPGVGEGVAVGLGVGFSVLVVVVVATGSLEAAALDEAAGAALAEPAGRVNIASEGAATEWMDVDGLGAESEPATTAPLCPPPRQPRSSAAATKRPR